MEIKVSESTRAVLEKRQKDKFAAIRPHPIYDHELRIPVRGTNIRCLEFVPKAEGKLPVVFDFHGGGFTNGYPEEDDAFCREVCDQLGVRVFSIEYRLAPAHPYPEGQLDAYETIAYMAAHADTYQIDPSRMVVCGHSAGGNLAVTCAMRAADTREFSLRGMILDYPPLDMATPAREKFYTEGCIPVELADIFNACYCTGEQARDPLCSPGYISDDGLRKLPPATIITCEIDSLREEAERFAIRLAANGVEVTVKRFLGVKHAFSVEYENPASPEAIRLMIRGIERYLTA